MSKRTWVRYRPPFRYDWGEVQAYYDAGHTFAQCQAKFGFAARSWDKARRRGDLTNMRPITKPLEALLAGARHRSSVKRRLLKDGILKNECSWCGVSAWRGKPLSMQIDHINGINNDHRLKNLRMLCPNCHSLTDTHGAKNRGRASKLKEADFLHKQ